MLSLVAVLLLPACDWLADRQQPKLEEVRPVPAYTDNKTPEYIFSSTVEGSIVYEGACQSGITTARRGVNLIEWDELQYGSYDDCVIIVESESGRVSQPLQVSPFSVVQVRRQPVVDTGLTEPLQLGVRGEPVIDDQQARRGRFTRLGSEGDALTIQNTQWRDDGNESNGSQWSCVKDRATGLTWEVKTVDGGLRDSAWTYTWFNPDPMRNGGVSGIPAMTDNCYRGRLCNTLRYMELVNSRGLCGYHDWRIPNSEELLSIVARDRVQPAIDTEQFPQAIESWYWQALSVASDSRYAWAVNFVNGSENAFAKGLEGHIRLVRGEVLGEPGGDDE